MYTSELRQATAVVYDTNHQALSTARFRRADQLATADTSLVLIHIWGPIYKISYDILTIALR